MKMSMQATEDSLFGFQHGEWMGQPVPAGRRPEPRGRRDRLPDQGRQAHHADAHGGSTHPGREGGEGAREQSHRECLGGLPLAMYRLQQLR